MQADSHHTPPMGPRSSPRWVCAMSGGVDSSVAAWMLREEGLEVVGLFMRNGVKVAAHEAARKSCCSVTDALDARRVAAALGIAFQAVDLGDEFRSVVRYFVAEYGAGRTPNPCAVCNRDLKFERLLEFADELGAEGVATGHYARIDRDERGRVRVRRGLDRDKDQSYQLFCVAERNLARTRLPLGALRKPAVRELARRAGLRTAEKADSQEICFVPGDDYRRLLAEEGIALHPGKLVDTAGRVLGEHAGTEHFTIGQRRGHGVAASEPLYVLELVPERGEVVLGPREEGACASCLVDAPNWIGFEPPSGAFACGVQVRYRSGDVPARVELERDGRARVHFDEPLFAVTPGQGAAFYEGERLLGGGWIRSAERVGARATRPTSGSAHVQGQG